MKGAVFLGNTCGEATLHGLQLLVKQLSIEMNLV